MGREAEVGDVFVVSTGDGRVGYGQVVGEHSKALYMALYDLVTPESGIEGNVEKALTCPVKFFTLTFDAKIHNGDWPVVGRHPVPDGLPFPAYRLGDGGRARIVSHDESMIRPATPQEATTVPHRKVSSPAVLERAFRASLGLEAWLPIFDGVVPSGHTTAALFPGA